MTAIPLTRDLSLSAQRTALVAAENALRNRSVRVFAVVIAVAAMSLADLYLTITYLQSAGMNEGNPLARFIMSFNCPWLLGAWKILLLTTTCSILLVARRARSAEVAAWLCCAVMIWLTGQWRQYAEKIPALTPVIHQLADGRSSDWVQFVPTPPAP